MSVDVDMASSHGRGCVLALDKNYGCAWSCWVVILICLFCISACACGFFLVRRCCFFLGVLLIRALLFGVHIRAADVCKLPSAMDLAKGIYSFLAV